MLVESTLVIFLREVADLPRLERALDRLQELTGMDRDICENSLNRAFTRRFVGATTRKPLRSVKAAANRFLDAAATQAEHLPTRVREYRATVKH